MASSTPEFEPVELTAPNGAKHTATTAVEFNNLVFGQGYKPVPAAEESEADTKASDEKPATTKALDAKPAPANSKPGDDKATANK